MIFLLLFFDLPLCEPFSRQKTTIFDFCKFFLVVFFNCQGIAHGQNFSVIKTVNQIIKFLYTYVATSFYIHSKVKHTAATNDPMGGFALYHGAYVKP